MGLLDGAKRKIQSTREAYVERYREEDEEQLREYIDHWWTTELKEEVEKGNLNQIEHQIEDFVQRVRNGKYEHPGNTDVVTGGSRALEVEAEEAKELLYFELIEYLEEKVEGLDRDIATGKRDVMVGKGFQKGNGRFDKQFFDKQLEYADKYRNFAEFCLEIGQELEVPNEELKPVKTIGELLEEREEALESIRDAIEQENIEEAKEMHDRLVEKLREEEANF